ncbi:hypothetical protein EDB86DRAFT_2919343 [Lactarius hatsudake]|nr:hypothetical protein EDB86DRAFT_2919343 [Lactarius hatsudake]
MMFPEWQEMLAFCCPLLSCVPSTLATSYRVCIMKYRLAHRKFGTTFIPGQYVVQDRSSHPCRVKFTKDRSCTKA